MIKHRASQYGTMWYIENVSDVKKIAYTDGEKGYDLDAIVLWHRRPTGRDYVTRRQFYCTGKPHAWCEQSFRSGQSEGVIRTYNTFTAPVDGTYTITITDEKTGNTRSYSVAASANESVYIYEEDIPEFSVVIIRFEPSTTSWDFLNENVDYDSDYDYKFLYCAGHFDTLDRIANFAITDDQLNRYTYYPESGELSLST